MSLYIFILFCTLSHKSAELIYLSQYSFEVYGFRFLVLTSEDSVMWFQRAVSFLIQSRKKCLMEVKMNALVFLLEDSIHCFLLLY